MTQALARHDATGAAGSLRYQVLENGIAVVEPVRSAYSYSLFFNIIVNRRLFDYL